MRKADSVSNLAKIVILFVAYFSAAYLGLRVDAVSGFATLVWPPTGIALVAVLFFGYRVWPGIFLAAVLVNSITGASFLSALGIGVGNTLEPIVGACLLQALGFEKSLRRSKDVLLLIVFGALLSTLVSATFGVASLWLTGIVPAERAWVTFRAWWVGDMMGDFIVAPLLLAWATLKPQKPNRWQSFELIALIVSAVFTAQNVFGDWPQAIGLVHSPLPYIIFPFVVWAAVRFGQIGTVSVVFLISGLAIYGTASGNGPFLFGDLNVKLLFLHSFLIIISTTGMILAAAIAESKSREEAFRKSDEAHTRLKVSEAMAKRRLEVQFNVASALSDSKSLNTAAKKVLQIIAEDLSWDFGAFWIVDEKSNTLKTIEAWHEPAIQVPKFILATRAWNFELGQGLPGRIWLSRKPLWISDIKEDRQFPRLGAAAEEGLRAAFGFPILSGEKVLGVAEFFSREVRPFDKELLRAIETSGAQFGQFMERLAALESLRQAVEARDEFLSIASHELKTPLTSLGLQLQITNRKIKPDLNQVPAPEVLAKSMRNSLKQVASLTNLVNELLDVSRIQTGKFSLNPEEVDFRLLVQDIRERFSEQLEAAGCELELDLEHDVVGNWDRFRMEQVLTNLISNVIKYAPGKPAHISLRKDPARALLVIRDNGPGVPVEKQSLVFERFERAVSTANVSGLGLGLYVVKSIVEAHRGTVRLESSAGLGSKFIVDLPLYPERES